MGAGWWSALDEPTPLGLLACSLPLCAYGSVWKSRALSGNGRVSAGGGVGGGAGDATGTPASIVTCD